MLVDFSALLDSLPGMIQVKLQVFYSWLIRVRKAHHFVTPEQVLVVLAERMHDVLNVVDERLLEELIFAVKL